MRLNKQKMDEALLELGFPERLKGTEVLRRAAEQYAERPGQSLTKELYPALAEAFNAEPTQIERNMRHAIERAWRDGNQEYQRRLFGWTYSAQMGRPTVGETIARIVRFCSED